MSQHDYIIDNAAGATVRADINNALAAIATLNSGTSGPSTPYAYQLWVDTANNLLKQRDSTNSSWLTVAELPVKGLKAGTALTMNPYAINTTQAQAHGLGQEPDLITGYIECLSADLNYSVGNRIDVGTLGGRLNRGAALENGFNVLRDSTNVTVITGSGGGVMVFNASTRAVDYITVAKWKLILTPWRIG